MSDCSYILPNGKRMNEAQFKAYLMNGGLQELKDLGFLDINIPTKFSGFALRKGKDDIDLLKLDKESKATLRAYAKLYENGVKSYEEVMTDLGIIADSADNAEAKQKALAVQAEFAKMFAEENPPLISESEGEQQADPTEAVNGNEKEFFDYLNTNQFGLSQVPDDLTQLEGIRRVMESGAIGFLDAEDIDGTKPEGKQKLIDVAQAWNLLTYGAEVANITNMFKQRYGNDYLKKMLDFVNKSAKKQEGYGLEAGTNVSIALNNELESLLRDEQDPSKKVLYKAYIEQNAADSLLLGRRASLLLNSWRAYNNSFRENEKLTMVVSPDDLTKIRDLQKGLSEDISDEQLLQMENGTFEVDDTLSETQEDEATEAKPMNLVSRLKLAAKAKAMKVKTASELAERIKKQIKNC